MIDLSLLMPEFSQKLRDFVLDAQYAGMDVDVECALRSLDEQNRLYALGRTIKNPDGLTPQKPMGNIVTNATSGRSWHNWGVAADVVFRQNGKWNWNVPNKQWFDLAMVAKKHGLMWGGAWIESEAKSLGDLDHFEYTNGLTIQEAMNISNMANVWAEIRRRSNG